MSPQIKTLLAVLGGAIAGVVVIFIGEMAASSMIHIDPEVVADPEKLKTFIQQAPASLFLTVLVVYLVASFVAGWVTNLIAQKQGIAYRPAMLAGVALAVMTVLNMMSMWHPTWFWVVSLVGILGCAWLGGRMVKSS